MADQIGPQGASQTSPAVGAIEPDDRSIGTLLNRLSSDMSTLFHQELELAKVEIKEEVTKAGKGAGMFGATAFCACLAVLLASFAAVWGMAEAIAVGWAFLCIAVLYLVAAGALFLLGRKDLKEVHGPQVTIETLKEDAEWARELRS